MRIGVLHNSYRFRGGEDRVVDAETRLLESAGHHVVKLTFDSRLAFASLGPALKSAARAASGWNGTAASRIQDWVREQRLDLVHIHNLFPLITGAGPDAILAIRVPIVATLHNFRAFCAAGTFTRDGESCNACVPSGPAPALIHGCAGSHLRTISWLVAQRRARSLWRDDRVTFIAPTQHVRDRYREGGFADARIVVRPHFSDLRPKASANRRGAVVVGRVEQAKGVIELVAGWPDDAEPLTVVGDGPDLQKAKSIARRNVRFTGAASPDSVAEQIGRAKVLISASLMPETFGLTLIEAAASGTVGVAFRNGGSSAIIVPGQTGCLVSRADFRTLIGSATALMSDEVSRNTMAAQALSRFDELYAPAAGLQSLEAIYHGALGLTQEAA